MSEHASTSARSGDEDTVTIPRRFCGPPTSGNGGWTAGAFAERIATRSPEGWPAIEVTLRRPPPLEEELTVVDTGDGWSLRGDGAAGTDVATARLPIEPPSSTVEPRETHPPALAAVDVDTAREAMDRYVGAHGHPFPTCFVCGTGRAEGDGLRIFPGRIADAADGSARVASLWIPHASHAAATDPGTASLPVTWGALDCAGAWAADFGERLMVLGRITARVRQLPRTGHDHVVVGQVRAREGRKAFTATALFDADGLLVGSSEQTWITVERSDFGG